MVYNVHTKGIDDWCLDIKLHSSSGLVEDLHGFKQSLFLDSFRYSNTWDTCKFSFVSSQVFGYSIEVLFLALFPKHILGCQLWLVG